MISGCKRRQPFAVLPANPRTCNYKTSTRFLLFSQLNSKCRLSDLIGNNDFDGNVDFRRFQFVPRSDYLVFLLSKTDSGRLANNDARRAEFLSGLQNQTVWISPRSRDWRYRLAHLFGSIYHLAEYAGLTLTKQPSGIIAILVNFCPHIPVYRQHNDIGFRGSFVSSTHCKCARLSGS